MGRRTLAAALVLVGFLGAVRAEEEPQAARAPSALTDAIQKLVIELPRVEEGQVVAPLEL